MVSRRLHADVSVSCTSIVGKTLFLLEGRRATSNKSGGSGVVNALGVLNPGRELRGVIVSVGLGVFRERGNLEGWVNLASCGSGQGWVFYAGWWIQSSFR